MRTRVDAYVRSLASGSDPDPAVLESVLEHLRRLLSAELRRRGLWRAPPRFLGIQGGSWWHDGGEPLDELVAECYGFIFLDRLRSLASRKPCSSIFSLCSFLSVDSQPIAAIGESVPPHRHKH